MGRRTWKIRYIETINSRFVIFQRIQTETQNQTFFEFFFFLDARVNKSEAIHPAAIGAATNHNLDCLQIIVEHKAFNVRNEE